MKRFIYAIKRFFLPSPDSSAITKTAPFILVAFLMVVLFVFSTYAWEVTNQVKFCGLTCHTMPPQYATHQNSSHANVTCDDCHLGRDSMAVMIPRKILNSWQTGTAMLTGKFTYPIIAKNMRPARDVCENCHMPEKFSADKMVELKHFADDQANTLTTTYLLLKTGGGMQRQGLGFGIHWHIENPVYFYATDPERQNIPYVVVTKPDGSSTEYVDTEAKIDPKAIKKEQLQVMDCITCHNRVSHAIPTPEKMMDDLIGRDQVSQTIPNIHQKGIEVLSVHYTSEQEAFDGIKKLYDYYLQNYADFYSKNTNLVKAAVDSVTKAYADSVFPDQKMDWATHPDNLQHTDSPGCFRCHDGKHVSINGKDTIRLECNLCHSIPAISTSYQLITNIPVEKGFEPDTHTNPNWINLHRSVFDKTCQTCHTTKDEGGISNTSFCSNSICHGSTFKFTGFDAPKLKVLLDAQRPTPAPATATPIPTLAPTASSAPTTQAQVNGYAKIGPIFQDKCGKCHGDALIKGLSLITYEKTMAGDPNGLVVVPGKPDESLLIQAQSKGNHPGQLSPDELTLVKQWITAGATKK